MSKLSLTLVAFTLCANQIDAARVAATEHSGVASLTVQQQKFRKAAKNAEADMVCRKPEIKETINKDKSVNGVTDINWDTVKATAADGMKQIDKSISELSGDIKEIEQKIRDLEAAGLWGELSTSDINAMLEAACAPLAEFSGVSDCASAVDLECGWAAPKCTEEFEFPPFEATVEAFEAQAKSKITGHAKLSVPVFREQCVKVFKTGECTSLCDDFGEKVRAQADSASGEVLGNTDTLDGLKAQLKTKNQELSDAEAEKAACAQAQTQLEAFRVQLGKLSGNYASSKLAVNRYNRMLRMRRMQLAQQIKILEEKKALLVRAKAIFAAASAQVEQRQADVAHMEGVIADLEDKLKKQMELIARIEAKIADIEAATETGRLFKIELSRVLSNAVDTKIQAIHKPLELLKITSESKIAADFDKAEEDAAPAMKATVRAVASFCAQADTSAALTNPLVKLEGSSEQLNFICVGQNWDNMISEAQSSVKGAAKQVVDILEGEQSSVVSDNRVPVDSSLTLRMASGEPKGLRHAVSAYGGQGGTFVDGYVNPGWTVEEKDGAVGTVGKMLKLYQKLGEAAELMTQQWEDAQAGARALEAQIKDALEQLEKLQELLRQAIAAKEIAEANMNEAQAVVDENEQKKQQMEKAVEQTQTMVQEGSAKVEEVKDALLKEHRERAAALLEVLQELKASRK